MRFPTARCGPGNDEASTSAPTRPMRSLMEPKAKPKLRLVPAIPSKRAGNDDPVSLRKQADPVIPSAQRVGDLIEPSRGAAKLIRFLEALADHVENQIN